MIGCLRTHVRKQPIVALYFEFETVLKFYNLKARSHFIHLYSMSQKSPRSRSEAKSQNGSIAEEIEEDIDDLSIEGDDLLRSEKSAVSTYV